MMNTLILIGFCIVASFIAFIICLQIVYWWFKVGPRMKMQQETNRLLKKIAGEQ